VKKIIAFLILLLVSVGCSSNNSFSEELYHDTLHLQAEIFVNKVIDLELKEEQKKLFALYEQKYSDTNKEEKELVDKMIEVKDSYQAYLDNEVQLRSEASHLEKYEQATSELYELVDKINSKYKFVTEEE